MVLIERENSLMNRLKNKVTICSIGLFFCFLHFTTPALALEFPPEAPVHEKLDILDEWLTELSEQSEFNGAVSIVMNGSPIFMNAYGVDGSKQGGELDLDSSFNLASVSKHFTAMAIVLLKADSKLVYTDPISKYLPELSMYSEVSVLDLIHHTSGLADYIEMAGDFSKDVFTTEDMLLIFQEQQPPLLFSPGSQFDYSNTGYVLLAEIVARVSGMPFEDFMNKRVFQPLGMSNSQVFNLLSESEPEKRVFGFERRQGWFRNKTEPNDLNFYDGVVGDGGVYASVQDLSLWHQALTNNTLVSQRDYKEVYQSGVLTDGSKTGYGFGWVVIDEQQVEHDGSWQGFSSYIYRNHRTGDLVVVLDNSTNHASQSDEQYGFGPIVHEIIKLQQSL